MPVKNTTTTNEVNQDDFKCISPKTLPEAETLELEVSDGRISKTSSKDSEEISNTKVYYHIDDEPTPYCTEVQVRPSKITLADFKRVLNRSNFKFYYKAIDQEVGGEVKAEIRDDFQVIPKSHNGQFELFLLTAEGSTNSDGTDPMKKVHVQRSMPASLNIPARRPQPRNNIGTNKQRLFGDSTMYATESDIRMFSDDESRLSTSTDNITSVSRQNKNFYRRRRRRNHRRQPSRASSLSSMTETSMALEVITVTLNMDTVGFLGISIVGQSCSRGDNGIYVANVMPGGAVALDGRIEPGDMILQVNEVSFEQFTNDQAVEVLKECVSRGGTIKLTVAKSLESDRSNYFTLPLREPVRPIDTHAWVQHTNAVRRMAGPGFGQMNSIPEGSEGVPTPIPGQIPITNQQQMPYLSNFNNHQRTSSSANSNTSAGSVLQQAAFASNGILMPPQRLDVATDRKKVVYAMALPNSGLDIRDHTWLKIPIPMSFLGSSLVDWLLEYIVGIQDRKDARKYASELLKERLIAHVVNKNTFTEQCYYVFGPASEELIHLRTADQCFVQPASSIEAVGLQNFYPMAQYYNEYPATSGPSIDPSFPRSHQQAFRNSGTSITGGEYASMPAISPYPQLPMNQRQVQQPSNFYFPHIRTNIEMKSQASNNSNESSGGSDQRRKAILPPAPSLSSMTPNDQAFNPIHQRNFPGLGVKPGNLPFSGQRPSVSPLGDLNERFGNTTLNSTNTGSLRFRLANEDEFFVDHI